MQNRNELEGNNGSNNMEECADTGKEIVTKVVFIEHGRPSIIARRLYKSEWLQFQEWVKTQVSNDDELVFIRDVKSTDFNISNIMPYGSLRTKELEWIAEITNFTPVPTQELTTRELIESDII